MFMSFERKGESVEQKHPTPLVSQLPLARLARTDGFFHRCGWTRFVRAFGKKSTGFGIAHTRASSFLSHSAILRRGVRKVGISMVSILSTDT